MKKLRLTFALFVLTITFNSYGSDDSHDFEVIAPIVGSTASAPSQIGSIVFEMGSNAFWGLGANSQWLQLSPSASTYLSTNTSISGCTSSNWCTMGTAGSVTLTAGTWNLTGTLDVTTTTSAITYISAIWSTTDGSPTNITTPTLQAGTAGMRQNANSVLTVAVPVNTVRVNVPTGTLQVWLSSTFTGGTLSSLKTFLYAEKR